MLKEVIQDFVSSLLFICFTVLPLSSVPDASMSTPKNNAIFLPLTFRQSVLQNSQKKRKGAVSRDFERSAVK